MTESDQSELLRKALEEFDAQAASCPFRGPKPLPSSLPCPKCRATSSEGCGHEHGAALAFVGAVRKSLASLSGGSRG